MKYCEKFAALLDPYVDGELSVEEAGRVRAHLERCPGCRSYADAALALQAAFPEAEETAVPEGFAEGVMAAVRELEAAKAEKAPPNARRHMHWKKILLPLAACFAVVLVLRSMPGGGSALPADGSTAAPAAMDAAESGGQYGLVGAAPHMEAADDLPAEADAESAPAPRMITEAPTASQDGPSAPLGSGLPDGAALQPGEGKTAKISGAAEALYVCKCRAIRLTAAQAGELLADLPYTTGEDGIRCYQLSGGDFDALLETLAERGVVPPEETAETEYLPEGYDLVYVTEE